MGPVLALQFWYWQLFSDKTKILVSRLYQLGKIIDFFPYHISMVIMVYYYIISVVSANETQENFHPWPRTAATFIWNILDNDFTVKWSDFFGVSSAFFKNVSFLRKISRWGVHFHILQMIIVKSERNLSMLGRSQFPWKKTSLNAFRLNTLYKICTSDKYS